MINHTVTQFCCFKFSHYEAMKVAFITLVLVALAAANAIDKNEDSIVETPGIVIINFMTDEYNEYSKSYKM